MPGAGLVWRDTKGDCMKLYLPLLEILFAFVLIYLAPEGILQLLKRRMQAEPSRLRKFMLDNLRGFLFGSAVALSFLFAFGVSYEDFAARTVRGAADGARRLVGMDAMTICKRRAREEFRYTPESFMEAASGVRLGSATLDRRDVLLARGYILLSSPMPISSPDELYDMALGEFCQLKGTEEIKFPPSGEGRRCILQSGGKGQGALSDVWSQKGDGGD